jgi:spore coat protein U-like protein
MKKILVLALAMGLVMALGGVAMAADSNTLTVQASVVGTCKFYAPKTSLLDFGNLDPSIGNNVNGSTTTQFWCTKGVTTDAVSAGNGSNYASGSRNMLGPGGDLIPYTLGVSKDATSNGGPLSPRTLTISGSVAGSDYLSKSAGAYSDTVVLTIIP